MNPKRILHFFVDEKVVTRAIHKNKTHQDFLDSVADLSSKVEARKSTLMPHVI